MGQSGIFPMDRSLCGPHYNYMIVKKNYFFNIHIEILLFITMFEDNVNTCKLININAIIDTTSVLMEKNHIKMIKIYNNIAHIGN